MSFYFHKLRRMKATQAVQEALNAAKSDETAKQEQEPLKEEKRAQEANKAVKRAPKKKGDIK